MIKKATIHDELMKKVLTYEKQRSYSWVAWFLFVIGTLIIGLGVSLWAFGAEVAHRQSLDLLSLFQEDWEIIEEYWQDTVGTFLEELPHEWIIVAIFTFIGFVGILWFTAVHRRRVAHRLGELASYGKIRNDTKDI